MNVIVFTLVTSFQKLEDMSWREWCPHLAIVLANCFIPKIKILTACWPRILVRDDYQNLVSLEYNKLVTGQ